MTAYFIIQINVKDKENYELYKNKVTPIVEKYGGKYIVTIHDLLLTFNAE